MKPKSFYAGYLLPPEMEAALLGIALRRSMEWRLAHGLEL